MRRFFELLQRFDWILLTAALSLIAIGLVAVYGIGVSREPAELFTFHKQFAALLIGGSLIFGMILFDYRYLRSYSLILYLVGAGLLLAVLFLGYTVNQTQGWFRLGSLSFQPVELAKIGLVVYLAALFAKNGQGRLSWKTWILSIFATGLYVGLVLLQPDFGSAMVMVGSWFLLSLFARLPKWALPALLVVSVVSGTLLWNYGLKPYQRDRIFTFLNPESDIRGAGYNAAQAQIAIGSGGMFGKGVGEGSQARLRFLPAAATDFMFAVLGESLGFAGLAVIMAVFALIIFRYIRLAHESEEDFAGLLMVGLASVLFIHCFVNMGMNLGIMPITGIPLPFLSAAASSLVVACLSVGIAESVAVRRRGNN